MDHVYLAGFVPTETQCVTVEPVSAARLSMKAIMCAVGITVILQIPGHVGNPNCPYTTVVVHY